MREVNRGHAAGTEFALNSVAVGECLPASQDNGLPFENESAVCCMDLLDRVRRDLYTELTE